MTSTAHTPVTPPTLDSNTAAAPSNFPVAEPEALLTTPLDALHREHGARMVPFAGHAMPVQYPSGIVAEHRHCRGAAALFDVSHMGQISLRGASMDAVAAALETLVPVDVRGLAPFQQRYAFFTNAEGGLLDDLMITRRADDWLLVVNAGCRQADLEHLRTQLSATAPTVTIEAQPGRALLALQGPHAVTALARLDAGVRGLVFMTGGWFTLAGADCFVTRSGYTGEDGFEISVPAGQAVTLATALLAEPEVALAGLGARDSLRLEAGLCLYGHDIGPDTTPVEAGLTWAIQKVRRPNGERAGGYPGADLIGAQLSGGAPRKRVGLIGRERLPVREGAPLFSGAGEPIGRVTSGSLTPSVDQAIAMGYVDVAHTALGTELLAEVRGKRVPMIVSKMPFAPHRYFRG